MATTGHQCCGRSGAAREPDVGPVEPAPDAGRWAADATLAKVRANLHELKKDAKDAGPDGPVRLVQQALRHWGSTRMTPRGLLLPQYGPDGHYGNETVEAVVAFQQQNRDAAGQPLAADGIVGDLTLGVLDALLRPAAPRPTFVPEAEAEMPMLKVLVDVVIFPDGHSSARLPRILDEANYVFGKAGLRIELGTVWESAGNGEAACRLFEANLAKGRTGTGPSTLRKESVDYVTAEVGRLMTYRPGSRDRITVYHLGPFPDGASTPWGASFTKAGTKSAFGVLMPNSATADPVDIWWHELGHCLLNTGENDPVDGLHLDHSHPFMSVTPFPGLGKASTPFSAAVTQRLRHTAAHVLR